MSTVDTVMATIKNELGKFLSNASIILAAKKKIETLKKSNPSVGYQLEEKARALEAQQSALESKAMLWIEKANAYKETLSKTDSKLLNAAKKSIGLGGNLPLAIWGEVKSMISDLTPLVNEGLVVSQKLVSINKEVEVLKESSDRGLITLPTEKANLINSGVLWLYGGLGVAITYFLARRK